ncbi:MAG: transketolase C-terminal domain-containing protein [Verrucomicrobiota bacterium]
MGADNTPVETVEAPPIKPIEFKSRLAGTPDQDPKYFVEITNASGETVKAADPKGTRGVVACMNVHAVIGGAACHWGGPAALAEVNSAIHAIMFSESKKTGKQWHELYHYVNDAGHTENGVYALRSLYGFDGSTFEDMKKFRSIESKFTGHGEAHLNPEGVLVSNGPLGSSLPQAQGLAMGDKIAGRDRVTLCVVSDGASYEGEAKESFAAIPGFAEKGQVNPFVMIISDNNTKLSGRCTDAFSMQDTFGALEAQGWKVIKVEDGNDLSAVYAKMEEAIAAAKTDPTKPVFVWLKTVKGFGIQATAESSSGGHGFPLKNGEKILDWLDEIYGGSEVPAELKEWGESLRSDWEAGEKAKAEKPAAEKPAGPAKTKIQAGLSKGMVSAAKAGLPVFSVSADLAGSTGTAGFAKAMPERNIDVGVAEANMISTAAGLSNSGFIPVVDTFAQFGITKGNLPLTMAALSQSPVIAVFSHVGFQDAADGASHQGLTYLAATSPIPHTTVVNLSCADEAEAFMVQAIEKHADARTKGEVADSVIFFLGRETYPPSWVEGTTYEWGKAQILREGSDVTFITGGSLVGKALDAAALLEAEGKSATVINNAFVNRVDLETIQSAVAKTGGRVVTLEDHQAICGMGSQVVAALTDAGADFKAKIIGVQGEFGQSAYTADELYDQHGLNAAGLVAAYKSLL